MRTETAPAREDEDYPIEHRIGPHWFIEFEPGLSVIRYHGDVTSDHMKTLTDHFARLPQVGASAVLTDTLEMGNFTPEARRSLAAMQMSGENGHETLVAVCGANAVRRAALTIAITAGKIMSRQPLESVFEFEYDVCLQRCRDWLAAHR